LTGIAPTFFVACIGTFLVGCSTDAFAVVNNVLAVRQADGVFVGRIISLLLLSWGITSLLSLPIGFAGDLFGDRATLLGLGVTLAVFATLLLLWERFITAGEKKRAMVAV
jgi:predicted MFS family arabinose efflux permease